MAALHSALQSLGPCTFSDIPAAASELDVYLQNLFQQSQLILESVPIPPFNESVQTQSHTTPKLTVASNASEISSSSARSAPPAPEYAALQREWGKAIRLGAKENPLNMAVYKMSGKDSGGSWFARRSVHEGIGFSRFKKSLEMEFPETLAEGRAPGKGNIRGIGGDQRIEEISLPGRGRVEVFQLSAQFPGPTVPRDFVTLLATSSNAMRHHDNSGRSDIPPRHYMVISKPCDHSETKPRGGYVRGSYESLEFIREVPRRPKKVMSSLDMSRFSGGNRKSAEMESGLGNAEHSHLKGTILTSHDAEEAEAPNKSSLVRDDSRRRGKTISFTGRRINEIQNSGADSDDLYDPEANPVEWIMVTRSDPGGSVPRFMVERGTPAGIVTDASKFLDWACQKEHIVADAEASSGTRLEDHRQSFTSLDANGYLAGVNTDPSDGVIVADTQRSMTESSLDSQTLLSQGDRNPNPPVDGTNDDDHEGDSDALSSLSFASADSHPLQDSREPGSSESSADQTTQCSSSAVTSATGLPKPKDSLSRYSAEQEKEYFKFQTRRAALDIKMASARQKWQKEGGPQTGKEKEAMRKAEDKHDQELKRQEAKYNREIEKLEERRRRDERRDRDRAEKKAKQAKQTSPGLEGNNDDPKTKQQQEIERERDEAREEVSKLLSEREIWRDQVGDLQRENTALAAKVGRLERTISQQNSRHLPSASISEQNPRGKR